MIQMVTDSLRFWVNEMHVDGFRFDLGTILAREPNGFDNQSGFLKACSQDPVLSRVKLIAEPWDCGPGGYQVGGFPPGWAEWNDQYRDTLRDFWRGEASAGKVSPRLYGSADIFNKFGRRPYASINFITAHDGFTLNDLVSYNEQAQRGQPRGQQGRSRAQPLLELRRRRPDRRPKGINALRAGRCATSWRRCCCRRARRCCSPVMSSVAPSTATTTPTARTTRSAGWTGRSPRRTRRSCSSCSR